MFRKGIKTSTVINTTTIREMGFGSCDVCHVKFDIEGGEPVAGAVYCNECESTFYVCAKHCIINGKYDIRKLCSVCSRDKKIDICLT